MFQRTVIDKIQNGRRSLEWRPFLFFGWLKDSRVIAGVQHEA